MTEGSEDKRERRLRLRREQHHKRLARFTPKKKAAYLAQRAAAMRRFKAKLSPEELRAKARAHYAALSPETRARRRYVHDPEKRAAFLAGKARRERERRARYREKREREKRLASYVPIIDKPRDLQASVNELLTLVAKVRAEREAKEAAEIERLTQESA